jgi:hypothetical protein
MLVVVFLLVFPNEAKSKVLASPAQPECGVIYAHARQNIPILLPSLIHAVSVTKGQIVRNICEGLCSSLSGKVKINCGLDSGSWNFKSVAQYIFTFLQPNSFVKIGSRRRGIQFADPKIHGIWPQEQGLRSLSPGGMVFARMQQSMQQSKFKR